MKQDSDSRRAFLQKFGALAASVTIVPIAAGCGGGDKPAANAGAEASGSAGGAATASVDCSDTSGLTDTDKSLRETLQYVEETPIPEKLCSNCQFYTTESADATCGGCTILKGPIAADGYCTSWAAMPS